MGHFKFSKCPTQYDQRVEKYRHFPGQRRPGDLSRTSDQSTIRVRQGKGSRSRIVPVHPELLNALVALLQFADVGRGRLVDASRSTAWRRVQDAATRAVDLGTLTAGRRVGTHTFRHSDA